MGDYKAMRDMDVDDLRLAKTQLMQRKREILRKVTRINNLIAQKLYEKGKGHETGN